MSATSVINPTSPVQRRDIRSTAQAFKRDKDASEKWANGVRPAAGVFMNCTIDNVDAEVVRGSNDVHREKVRPRKQWSQVETDYKSHANKVPKPTSHITQGYFGGAAVRLERKANAIVDSNDSNLSKSLLELLPQHVNNTDTPIQTAILDAGVFYSYDNKGASGGSVALGGLVEKAEKKWISEQTERIVRGEYEVLDAQGETTVLKGKKKSPKQKAVKKDLEEDDGFELIEGH